MDRCIALLLLLVGLTGRSNAQAYGMLLGGRSTAVNAAGVSFTPARGISCGLFMPFYVNDRLVVRTEAGFCMMWWKESDQESAQRGAHTQADLALLLRYYLTHRISIGTGIQGSVQLHKNAEPLPYVTNGPPNGIDLTLLLAAAYRFNERFELGMRYGSGLLPVAEMDVYGTAYRRTFQVTTSYLLHPSHTCFLVRRNWHSVLGTTQRY